MLINTTPHPINIIGSNDEIAQILPAAEHPWRLEEFRIPGLFEVEGIPVNKVSFKNAERPPLPVNGTFYIVSQIIKQQYPDREDFLAPDQVLRSVKGEILGCKSFRV